MTPFKALGIAQIYKAQSKAHCLCVVVNRSSQSAINSFSDDSFWVIPIMILKA
jgi:hypothetical protein